MQKSFSKRSVRAVKILVLVVAPWFTTGCAGLQAILPLITGLASKLGGASTPSTAAAAGANGIVRAPVAPATSAQVPIGQSRPFVGTSIRASDSRDTLRILGAN